VGNTLNILHSMALPVRFDIRFNFDRRKSISFVCQKSEYEALCEVLSENFENFEIEQFENMSSRDNLFPDERLHRRLTSSHSIFSKEKYTHRQSDKSLTITISRDEDDSWIFKVVDLNGKKHQVFNRNSETQKHGNWRPGDYDAYYLFRFIGLEYVFGEEGMDNIT
jgi:hypothetical protein